ncbi:hypothetical protein GCM10027174_27630 [Salinifilum aidingensis]
MTQAAAVAYDAFGLAEADRVGESMPVIGGRLFVDMTAFARARAGRAGLVGGMRTQQGSTAAAGLAAVLEDPRFAPTRRLPVRLRGVAPFLRRLGPSLISGTARALARPAAARARAFAAAEVVMRVRGPGDGASAHERLQFVDTAHQRLFTTRVFERMLWPLYAGLAAGKAPHGLLSGIAADGEVDAVLRGMPHNPTTDMDLALWRLARDAAAHRELLTNTPPQQLAADYQRGRLPDLGLAAFLARYGHRAAAEVDVGTPRWREDPTPVFTALANYLRVTDPSEAPDRRYATAAAEAEATLDDLVERARGERPLRARLAGFCMRRARALSGLRELPKSAWSHLIGEVREQLLAVGAELAAAGRLDTAEDVLFLEVLEVRAAVDGGVDHRALVAQRRAEHAREQRRPRVPELLLSDGTEPELLAPEDGGDGALRGTSGAPGRVTGTARVLSDPSTARLDPGDVLVAATTDPGWTHLFLTAGGVVTESGGPNAHGPTVAREYGIPAVIGVFGATRRLVDGTAGTASTVTDAGAAAARGG